MSQLSFSCERKVLVVTRATVFLAIGQLVFQQSLETNLSTAVSPEIADLVISTGATQLASTVDTADLPLVIDAYGKAIVRVFVSIQVCRLKGCSLAPFHLINPYT